MYCRSSS